MNRCFIGDCRDTMRELITQGVKVQTCVTSPPYWGLRDYGHPGQLGLEATYPEYVERLVEVFRLVRDLLADDGTLWLNLGDSYATGAGAVGSCPGGGVQGERWRGGHEGKHGYGESGAGVGPMRQPNRMPQPGLKAKDLVGIPWRVAFALQADGCADMKACAAIERVRSDLLDAYEDEPPPDRVIAALERLDGEYREAKGRSWYLRSDIIWHKPNPMPESVTDRPTKSHEYIFLLTKSERCFYDHEAIKEPQSENERTRRLREQENGLSTRYNLRRASVDIGQPAPGKNGVARSVEARQALALLGTRNKRSVWTVPSQPFSGAHFATFPPELIEPCILAGSRPGDVVLDPFFGSGTTGEVAQRLGRKWIGCELNPAYVPLQKQRTAQLGIEL